MKRVLTALAGSAVMIGLLLVGIACDKIQNPVLPGDEGQNRAAQLIKLPRPDGLPKIVTASKFITVKDGGTLSIESKYKGGPHGEVSIKMNLKVESQSVNRDVWITASLDDQTLQFEFGPSGLQFSKLAKLNLEAKGLDLSNIPRNARIKLLYFNDRMNEWQEIRTKEMEVDLADGKIDCEGGEIPHFSRYAFGY